MKSLRQVREELDDLAVLALFAAFERSVLDYLCSVAVKAEQDVPTPLEAALVAEGLKDVDRWYLGDVLDTYKVVVASDTVGDVKQVKEYRDWVAHGKRESPASGREKPGLPSTPMDPRSAYGRLKRFLASLGRLTGECAPS